MLKKIKKCYTRQSLSKKIGISIFGILLFSIILITSFMTILICKIRQQQLLLPSGFFQQYSKYSFTSVGNIWRDLILSVLDNQNYIINQVRNAIMNQRISKLNVTKSKQYINSTYGTKPNQLACLIKNTNQSIFQCQMDLYTKFILQSVWPYQKNIKRFNIIYQNNKDANDFMIKTISQKFDFSLPQSSYISKLIKKQQNGILTFSNFYYDKYGISKDKLVAFRTKISFPTYNIILQLQTYGTFITSSISKNVFSNSTNIVVLSLNKSDSNGYSLVASYDVLNPYINYTKLLQPGFKSWVTISGRQFVSHTNYLSSAYTIGDLSHSVDQRLKDDYCNRTNVDIDFTFINQFQKVLFIVLGIEFFVLVLIIFCHSYRTYNGIQTSIQSTKNNLHSYMKQSKKYPQILQNIIVQSQKDISFKKILRTIYEIIKNVQRKKRKNQRKIFISDIYPYSTFNKQFQTQQKFKDFNQIQFLFQRICNKAQFMKQLPNKID